jgi:hypothetical protein
MKKLLLTVGLIVALCTGVWAQTPYDDFAAGFQAFADGVATTLPATAAVSGLNWSPAYIGKFPHFGVGLSVGAFTIPYDALSPVLDKLSISLPSEYQFIEKYGLPFPAVALDARLGFKPFDVGFKIGLIPDAAREHMGAINADYFLIGGDLRLPILREKGFVPSVSVSAGYTYWRASFGVPDVLSSGDYVVDLASLGEGYIKATAPELAFTVQTHSFVAKLQASKNLFILTPHLGLGAAYGISNAGGGLSSDILYSPDNITYSPITQSQIDQISAAFDTAGQTAPDLTTQGILVGSAANGFSAWVYGGTAINIFFIKVDVSAMYNFLSGSYGGAVNVRLQL